jgi:hypothetical protein
MGFDKRSCAPTVVDEGARLWVFKQRNQWPVFLGGGGGVGHDTDHHLHL